MRTIASSPYTYPCPDMPNLASGRASSQRTALDGLREPVLARHPGGRVDVHGAAGGDRGDAARGLQVRRPGRKVVTGLLGEAAAGHGR